MCFSYLEVRQPAVTRTAAFAFVAERLVLLAPPVSGTVRATLKKFGEAKPLSFIPEPRFLLACRTLLPELVRASKGRETLFARGYQLMGKLILQMPNELFVPCLRFLERLIARSKRCHQSFRFR